MVSHAGRLVLLQKTKPTRRAELERRAGLQVCSTTDDIRAVLRNKGRHSVISSDRALTKKFVELAAEHPQYRATRFVTLQPPEAGTASVLSAVADRLLGTNDNFRWLPTNELCEVIQADDETRRTLAIGGAIDEASRQVVLVLGDLNSVRVPFKNLKPSGDGTKPDFSQLEIRDFGHSVAFGDYEAAVDALLYEVDSDFRKRLKVLRSETDGAFGSCLRRLRLQRGLSRDDFGSISSKTIARIERGETTKPRGRTLQQLAERLGVAAAEIEEF